MISHRQITAKKHDQFIIDNNLVKGAFVSAKTGENLVKIFYEAAAYSVGIVLSGDELALHNKVVKAYIPNVNEEDEGRTAFADDMEAEDLAAERRKHESCNCIIN